MIKQIIHTDDQTLAYIADDPVRPHIPALDRVQGNKKVFYLANESNDVLAMVCLAFTDDVATTEEELNCCSDVGNAKVCMFYTIWSYSPGAGRQLALSAIDYIKDNYANIKRIVTLSPQTEMARKFHLKNGANELQTNLQTVNFEYSLP